MSFLFDNWELDDDYNSNYLPSITPDSITSINSFDEQYQAKRKRRVKYANTCAVILIPTRREYIEAGIDLWYSKGDQTSAQLQMAADVNNLIHYNPSLSIEQAMDFLLQPRIDYLSSFTTLNPSTTQDNLSLMIIDKDKSSFDDSSKSILQSLRECNRFSITCTHAMSAEQSLKIISNSSDGVINKIDIIILDSNLYENRDINYLSLLRMFRSVYGETILIGVLFPTLSHVEEEFRQRAIKAGVDFIWAKPVAQYADMLPLLISIRRAKDAAKL